MNYSICLKCRRNLTEENITRKTDDVIWFECSCGRKQMMMKIPALRTLNIDKIMYYS